MSFSAQKFELTNASLIMLADCLFQHFQNFSELRIFQNDITRFHEIVTVCTTTNMDVWIYAEISKLLHIIFLSLSVFLVYTIVLHLNSLEIMNLSFVDGTLDN